MIRAGGPRRPRHRAAALAAAAVLAAAGVTGQDVRTSTDDQASVVVARGRSTVVENAVALARVSIGDPEVADAVVVSDREVVVIGRRPGSTTLLLWDEEGGRSGFDVHVTADVSALSRQLAALFPDDDIRVLAAGRSVVLEGTVRDPEVARKAKLLAESLLDAETSLLDHIAVPDRGQVLLQVRFAEVDRSALREIGFNFLRIDPEDVRGDDEAALSPGAAPPLSRDFVGADGPEQTFSDAVNFFVFHRASSVSAFVRALQSRGVFRSLAEPNLLALAGEEASFLAGGEFPFPVVQPGALGNAVTVQFREFGVRLAFRPSFTAGGAIRLKVAPEVSTLDFGNSVVVAGTRIPVLLTRHARTVVELEDGQTFAIAGLIDNSVARDVRKIPLLGDIPILGKLFRSEEVRQNRSELLVLVTPRIVRPQDAPPALPTGEPETWGAEDESDPPALGAEGEPR